MRNNRIIKAMALLLSIAVFVGLFPAVTVPVLSVQATKETTYVMYNDERVSEVVLEEDGKFRIEAYSDHPADTYQWQIRHPEEETVWIDVADGYSRYLWVTYALIDSMLREDGTADLRCRMTVDGNDVVTAPVTVTLSYVVPVDPNATLPELPSIRYNNRMRATNREYTTYTIVINYLFDNNTIAFESYGASIAAGSDFTRTVPSPSILGYAPYRRVGEDYLPADTVVLDLKNVQENITINVIYEPTLVDFKVHHHYQNVLDDEYSATPDRTTTTQGLTGSLVGPGLALTDRELPGFKPLAYDDKLIVAADGSTVVEIRYDRNYYLIEFDMNGGYGTEPVYTRYGATVGANNPIRHGYRFDGWELVSYGEESPTADQRNEFALQAGTTIEVPAANLKYRARWITQETTYTLVFWQENADDNGYSYWGYLDGIKAMSGSYVDAADRIDEVDGIKDAQYFTFNSERSDKHVLVEGDGSTVVNVYYTRNYYKITFKATGTCTIPTGHTHGDACYDLVCGKTEHTHTAACERKQTCTVTEHTAHTEDCILCGYAEHVHGGVGCDCNKQQHTHAVNCWSNLGNRQNNTNSYPKNKENGYIYKSGKNYYIYLFNTWYRYTGQNVSNGSVVRPTCGLSEHTHGTDCACNLTPHTHEARCYSDSLHTHTDDCYRYLCNADNHTHASACQRLHCGIPVNHTHNSTCTSSRSTNTVKLVYAKYDQSIKDLWPVTDDHGNKYNTGQRWTPSDSTYYKQVLVYIAQMPPDDFTLTISNVNYDTFNMMYYLQVLPGQAHDRTYNGKYYKLYNTIKANYNFITKAEDFFDIEGFVQAGSSPNFDNSGQLDINGGGDVYFYYDRVTDHYLHFNNNGTVLEDKSVYGVMYGAPLKEYNFTPPYPTNLEPNAYTFDGWYISPGCFPGTEVNWETLTSPVGDLMLYAKWKPITHTVRVFKDNTLTEQIGATQIVDHKAFAHAPDGNVSNGNYVFQGWFYKDVVNGEEVEKAFSFGGIPVLKDLDIYAKWSSHVAVNYTIYYKLKGTDIQIADPTTGSAIAGNNKTFDAKTEQQLYAGYQSGYFPHTSSHTITMSIEGDHEFTFYYEFVDAMPYKVEYVNSTTGQKLCDDVYVVDNRLSVVTETFKRFDKMMPDAYQKRLVLSSNKTDADGDNVYDDNVITFYYTADEVHAYYRVVHYIQNVEKKDYREYRSEEMVGVIGESYLVHALNLTGFAYNGQKTAINGVVTPTDATSVTAKLSADGLLVEFYYDRLNYTYTVHYLDSKTREERYPAKTGYGSFGEQVVEYAVNLESLGYELAGVNVKAITLSANPEHNVIEFLYQEKTVSLRYQIVGPVGCGSLSQYSENIAAVNGIPNGSAPIVSKGFLFRGWYLDAACTKPVDPSWVNGNNELIPRKTGSIWTATTYYAKFAAMETDLTITTKSTAAIDANQVFLFTIRGKEGTDTAGVNLTVTVVGNGSVTVTKLPTGDYTVTELTDWSWRYENSTAQREITLEYTEGTNELVYDNSREHGKWLDGNTVKDNRF